MALLAPSLFAEPVALKSSAVEQIRVLMDEKRSRTPAQRKVGSDLLMEIHRTQKSAFLEKLPQLQTRARVAADGKVLVDLGADVSEALLWRIGQLGGEVVNAHPKYRAVRARLPLSKILALAEDPSVTNIRSADQFTVRMTNTTEGDVAHGADTARTTFGVDGTGVQVGAISDSVDALATLQASGDLPGTVTVLAGQSGNPGTSEGTALLEIVHDMAPGADLFFATAAGGTAQLAQNILDLQAEGCDVIVDDVLYFIEPVFQDGIIAQAVDTVAAAGTIYVSSAGNSGNLNSGTSGTWEGIYSGDTLPTPLSGMGMTAHNFGSGVTNEVTLDGPSFFTLHWGEAEGNVLSDYDLFLLDSTASTVVDSSTDSSTFGIAFEDIDTISRDDTGNLLVVVHVSGTSPHFIHLSTQRGELAVATEGETYGHPAAEGALSVGAVRVPMGGGVFDGTESIEAFSSDGPRRILFDAAGNPTRPSGAERGINTGIVRDKPDVSGANGVSTATPGFETFFGTSASAPHIAGVSALFRELFPNIPPGNAFDIFRSTALDIEAPGPDRDSGSGIVNANEALNPVLFADGFESGDATAWTNEVP